MAGEEGWRESLLRHWEESATLEFDDLVTETRRTLFRRFISAVRADEDMMVAEGRSREEDFFMEAVQRLQIRMSGRDMQAAPVASCRAPPDAVQASG